MTCRHLARHQDGLEQSPANPLLTHLHHLSSTKLSIPLQGSQIPGQHLTNLTQPASPGISNPGWYLLHHRAEPAPPKQRGCVYSPYSNLPKSGFAHPCSINTALSTSSGTAHPGGCTDTSGLESKAHQREGQWLGRHVLASAPSQPQPSGCSTKRFLEWLRRHQALFPHLPPGSTGQLKERRRRGVTLTC